MFLVPPWADLEALKLQRRGISELSHCLYINGSHNILGSDRILTKVQIQSLRDLKIAVSTESYDGHIYKQSRLRRIKKKKHYRKQAKQTNPGRRV